MPSRAAYQRYLQERGLSENDIAPMFDPGEKNSLLAIAPAVLASGTRDPALLTYLTEALKALNATVNDVLTRIHDQLRRELDLPGGAYVGAYPTAAFDGEAVQVPGGTLILVNEGMLQMVEAAVNITSWPHDATQAAALRQAVGRYVTHLQVPGNTTYIKESWAEFDATRNQDTAALCTAAESFVILHEYGHIELGLTTSSPEAELEADRWALEKIADAAAGRTGPILLGPIIILGLCYLIEKFTPLVPTDHIPVRTHPGALLRLAQAAIEVAPLLGDRERSNALDYLALIDATAVAGTHRDDDAITKSMLRTAESITSLLAPILLTLPRVTVLETLIDTAREGSRADRAAAGDASLPVGLRESATSGVYIYDLPGGRTMEMVLVPRGDFLYGPRKLPGFPGPDDVELSPPPATETVGRDFYIGRYPVTEAQFAAFRGRTENTSQPAVNVTVQDAEAFCRWAGLRLPSEHQWEKAARGTDGRLYPSGTVPIQLEPRGAPAPALPDAGSVSPFGAEHMTGNVWQLTSDWLESSDPMDAGRYRVVRGGSYRAPQRLATVLSRHRITKDFSRPDIGFRAVLPTPEEPPPTTDWMTEVLAEAGPPAVVERATPNQPTTPDQQAAAARLFGACRRVGQADLSAVRQVIRAQPDAVGWRDTDGSTPLLRVAGNLPYFEIPYLMAVDLLEAGADVNAQNQAGATALHLLAIRPQGYSLTLARSLMQRGADLSLLDSRGFTIRMVAERFAAMMGHGFLAILAEFEN